MQKRLLDLEERQIKIDYLLNSKLPTDIRFDLIKEKVATVAEYSRLKQKMRA